jgi:peroxiredoxin Q/BCP
MARLLFPSVGDPAPRVDLVGLDGERVPIARTWADRDAVLVFLRYFGCPFCQAQVVSLHADRDRLAEAGAGVVLIGQGDPDEARDFLDRKQVGFDCLIDPDRTSYRAYGLRRARPGQVFGPRVGAAFLRTNLNRDTRQGGLHGGSFWQMPGTFVVDRNGTVRLAHRNRHVADSPSNRVILETLAAVSRTPPA